MKNRLEFFQFYYSPIKADKNETSKYRSKIKNLSKLKSIQKEIKQHEDADENDTESGKKLDDLIRDKEFAEDQLKYLEDATPFNRISRWDIDRLNKRMDEMNESGWRVKQIEAIQSGDFGYNDRRDRKAYGYGYSFTEGIMILWEKD